jgi:hypothetical protein
MSLSSCRVNNDSSHGFGTKDVRTIDAGDVQRHISSQLTELLWKQIGWQKAIGYSFVSTVSPGKPLDINVERSGRLAPILEALKLDKAGSPLLSP